MGITIPCCCCGSLRDVATYPDGRALCPDCGYVVAYTAAHDAATAQLAALTTEAARLSLILCTTDPESAAYQGARFDADKIRDLHSRIAALRRELGSVAYIIHHTDR